METIINNPTRETAAENGMYDGMVERMLFTDEKVIKRIATTNLNGTNASLEYLQTIYNKNYNLG